MTDWPKVMRDTLKKTEGRVSVEMASVMPLSMIHALEWVRPESDSPRFETIADAIAWALARRKAKEAEAK